MSHNHAMRRIVVKVGTSSLTYPNGKLNIGCIEKLARVISDLQNRGYQMVLVSSGAVGVGAAKLGWRERPRDIRMKQAAAAVGQCELMHIYDKMFLEYGVKSAQILLTRENITNEEQRANIHSTFDILLDTDVVPIVNENDTVATAELECIETFGDNDTLSAVVARVCAAICSSSLPTSKACITPTRAITRLPSSLTAWRRLTRRCGRLRADRARRTARAVWRPSWAPAELCMDAGISMLITKGDAPEILYDIVAGKPVGTLFKRPPRKYHFSPNETNAEEGTP